MRLRAPFTIHGGKGNMLARLLPLIPSGGRPYCEPFAGAASVLFARERAPVEVLNDINGDIVNFFRCLQDKETFEELRHRIMYTPYARDEFARALELLNSGCDDRVLRAWAFFVSMSQSIYPRSVGCWSRAFVSRNGVADNVNSWLMRLSMFDAFRWRLMTVQIDNRDAVEVIKYWDNEEAVFYVDPPYILETKGTPLYKHEMTNEQHEQLIDACIDVKGSMVISCYDHPIYQRLEKYGWKKVSWKTASYTAARTRSSGILGKGSALERVPRVETVYLNRKASDV